MSRKLFAAGRLPVTVARLHFVPQNVSQGCVIVLANAGSSANVNLYIDGDRFSRRRLIGKDTVLAAASKLELTFPVYLGPGDEIWGDSSADVDFVISGEEGPA